MIFEMNKSERRKILRYSELALLEKQSQQGQRDFNAQEVEEMKEIEGSLQMTRQEILDRALDILSLE
jgi:hypothetical protein